MKDTTSRIAALAIAVASVLFGPGFTASAHAATGPSLDALKEISSKCPSGRSRSILIAIDAGGAPSKRVTAARLGIVDQKLLDAAVCAQATKVIAFRASSIDTRTLYSAQFRRTGSTANARLWAAAGSAREAQRTVRQRYRSTKQVSDPLGVFELAPAFDDVIVLTSGLGRAITIDDRVASLDAAAVARGTGLPDLRGHTVTMATLGVTAGASTTFVKDVKSFWDAACASTGATCRTSIGI